MQQKVRVRKKKPPKRPAPATAFKPGDPRISKVHQFQPGNSGNPDGSSRNRRLTSLLQDMLEEEIRDPAIRAAALAATGHTTWDRLFLHGLRKGGALGDVRAHREVLDRLEGKVPQGITDGEGKPLAPGTIVIEVGRRGGEGEDE